MATYGHNLLSFVPDMGTVTCIGNMAFDSSNPVSLPSAHWRSRGRHEPGSGPYCNRYVKSDSVPAIGVNGYFAVDRVVETRSEAAYVEPGYARCKWDGKTWFQATIESRRSGPLAGRWCLFANAYYIGKRGWHYTIANCSWCRIEYIALCASTESRSYAWSLAQKYIEHLLTLNFESAQLSPYYYGSYSMQFAVDSGCIGPGTTEPKFSSQMGFFADRLSIGDPTLNVDGAMSAAYINAADNLPSLSGMNNIANGLQALSALKSLLSVLVGSNRLNAFGSLSKGLKDAWLSYRYTYCTTKADCEEALRYLSRIEALGKSETLTSNGTYRQGDWLVKCSISINRNALDGVQSFCEKYGLALNAYNAWDLIPYSFMVDWFLDVGSLLETYEKRNFAYHINPYDIWFSFERRFTNEYGLDEVYYYRFRGSRPSLSFVSRGTYTPKVTTWFKRGLDVLAIFS